MCTAIVRQSNLTGRAVPLKGKKSKHAKSAVSWSLSQPLFLQQKFLQPENCLWLSESKIIWIAVIFTAVLSTISVAKMHKNTQGIERFVVLHTTSTFRLSICVCRDILYIWPGLVHTKWLKWQGCVTQHRNATLFQYQGVNWKRTELVKVYRLIRRRNELHHNTNDIFWWTRLAIRWPQTIHFSEHIA